MNSQKAFYVVINSIATLILLAIIGTAPVIAQFSENSQSGHISPETKQVRDNPFFDHVINRRGGSRFTLATGIPFVGVAEYAYGVTDRFTVGVLGGITPAVEGYGVRLRSVIFQKHDHYRVYFCTPVIYYPTLSGGDPWWLARPNINFEWVKKNNVRYKFGGSAFLAASNNSLFGNSRNATLKPDVWSSVHGGVSLPIGRNLSFQTEVSYVSKGIRPINDFVGAPPVVLVLGVSYSI